MPLLDGEQFLRAHLDANPDAHHAALHDPEYAASVHHLQTTLDRLGHALAAEGITDEDQARRIGARLATDLLGTDESNARMESRARLVRDLYDKGVVHMPVPVDLLGRPS
ncbi:MULTISPECIES: hypothetical protein [unclassified Streptomyces]|uniref:hypothetical protein n=1 Tax=unclassified Streptomyces TaxID=2593676 RepID=UPI00093F970B|nr:hypothetical protein [Streptomyces sp. TSRI0281]OKI35030.1 hypothetical protein A6A29_16545 [Streptomyces sp. TSRI0281]